MTSDSRSVMVLVSVLNGQEYNFLSSVCPVPRKITVVVY